MSSVFYAAPGRPAPWSGWGREGGQGFAAPGCGAPGASPFVIAGRDPANLHRRLKTSGDLMRRKKFSLRFPVCSDAVRRLKPALPNALTGTLQTTMLTPGPSINELAAPGCGAPGVGITDAFSLLTRHSSIRTVAGVWVDNAGCTAF